jgi:prophage regulatory protein
MDKRVETLVLVELAGMLGEMSKRMLELAADIDQEQQAALANVVQMQQRAKTHRPRAVSKILRVDEVCEMVGISKSQIYRLMRRREFPKPVALGVNSVGWTLESIQSWAASRPAVLT